MPDVEIKDVIQFLIFDEYEFKDVIKIEVDDEVFWEKPTDSDELVEPHV